MKRYTDPTSLYRKIANLKTFTTNYHPRAFQGRKLSLINKNFSGCISLNITEVICFFLIPASISEIVILSVKKILKKNFSFLD